MPLHGVPGRFAGEITERAELLNGAIQLSLDGESDGSEGNWSIELALSWRLGRPGAVPLDEGDFTLESGEREVIAILDSGSAELDGDTGDVEVDAVFTVEGATGVDVELDTPVRARLSIGAERWSGEFADAEESEEVG
jgi:hypothetical protein